MLSFFATVEVVNRFFGSATILIPLILAPFTLLLILSQNTVPGDLLYPYKRGVEIMILAAASLHPETRVAFRTDLTERRFNEAETLLLAKQDVATLETFLKEVRETETAIAEVSNTTKKAELKKTLIAKIDNYQARLTQIETKVSSAQPTSFDQTGNNIRPPQGSSSQNQDNFFPTSTPVSVQRNTPTTTVPTRKPDQIIPTPSPPVDIGGAIERTKDELEKIKDKTKKEKEENKKEEKEENKDRQDKNDRDHEGKDEGKNRQKKD